MLEKSYIPQVIKGRPANNNEDFNPVIVNEIPLISYENPDYPSFNWGYGGTGPMLLAMSLTSNVFGIISDSEINGKLYLFGAASKFIETNYLKKFKMSDSFQITDVDIAKKLYPYLVEKINVAIKN
jgi:hypothetical protein